MRSLEEIVAMNAADFGYFKRPGYVGVGPTYGPPTAALSEKERAWYRQRYGPKPSKVATAVAFVKSVFGIC